MSQLDNDDGGGDSVDAGDVGSDDGGAEYIQLSPKQTDGKFRAAVIVWGKVAAKLFIPPQVRLTLKTQNLLLVFLKQNFCWYYPNVEGIFMLIFCSFSGVFAC